MTGECKNMTPLVWKPSASLVISVCSVRVFTLRLHAWEKKEQTRLQNSGSCSSPQSLCGHSRACRCLSLIKSVVNNLGNSLNTLSTCKTCRVYWFFQIIIQKKKYFWQLFGLFSESCAIHNPFAISFLCHLLKQNENLLWEIWIPGLQLWCPTTKQAAYCRWFTSLTAWRLLTLLLDHTSAGSNMLCCRINRNTRTWPVYQPEIKQME